MSVGVCIINRNGIALAADSAGTYTGNKMFYNSMKDDGFIWIKRKHYFDKQKDPDYIMKLHESQ